MGKVKEAVKGAWFKHIADGKWTLKDVLFWCLMTAIVVKCTGCTTLGLDKKDIKATASKANLVNIIDSQVDKCIAKGQLEHKCVEEIASKLKLRCSYINLWELEKSTSILSTDKYKKKRVKRCK